LIPDNIEKPKRTIGTMEILAASFNILNTWFGLASTLVLGFSNGGPVTIIYGLILISIVYTATAFSLAELSAKYPTAGGQYHWTSLLASPATKRAFVRFLS
jgi:amino acid transporter